MTLAKTTGHLHDKFGSAKTSSLNELVPALQKIYLKLGRGVLRENIKTFWEVMDECFKVKQVTFKEVAAFLKQGFLFSFADVISDHQNFWDDAKLVVNKDLRRKIALFPINDPEIGRLASAAGPATDILYELMVKHINSGKRTHMLVPSRKEINKPSRKRKRNKLGEEEESA
jgi:hypothetical protein